ncbi:MAG: amidohydrolase family protein, partial [Hyphomicrobiaceae bacterium]
TRGERLSVPFVVAAQARRTAASVGLRDRGILAPGYKADINVIDYDRLKVHPPEVRHDLPKGGRRLVQKVTGYDATILSGTIVRRGGVATGALPGRLVRGMQPVPAARTGA